MFSAGGLQGWKTRSRRQLVGQHTGHLTSSENNPTYVVVLAHRKGIAVSVCGDAGGKRRLRCGLNRPRISGGFRKRRRASEKGRQPSSDPPVRHYDRSGVFAPGDGERELSV